MRRWSIAEGQVAFASEKKNRFIPLFQMPSRSKKPGHDDVLICVRSTRNSSTMWMLMSLFLFFQCSACHQTRNSHRRKRRDEARLSHSINQISERNRHHRHDLLSPRERGRKREREQRLIINMCELDRRSYRSVETRDWAKLDSIWMHR